MTKAHTSNNATGTKAESTGVEDTDATFESDKATADPMSQDKSGPAYGDGAIAEAGQRSTGALEDEAKRRPPFDPAHSQGRYPIGRELTSDETEAESARLAKNPNGRVSLASIQGAILSTYYVTGAALAEAAAHSTGVQEGINQEALRHLQPLTICVITVRNGFSVIGKSAPADPLNYDETYGRKLAYDDAMRQLWPLFGFAKREELAAR